MACEDERGAAPFTAFWVLGVDDGAERPLVMTVSFFESRKEPVVSRGAFCAAPVKAVQTAYAKSRPIQAKGRLETAGLKRTGGLGGLGQGNRTANHT
jgi:hypothetical protein